MAEKKKRRESAEYQELKDIKASWRLAMKKYYGKRWTKRSSNKIHRNGARRMNTMDSVRYITSKNKNIKNV